jgi:AraC-like DNA-binding protein
MPSPFSLEYFDPAPGQEREVLTSFQYSRDDTEIVDRHPGALPQLAVFLRGEGGVQFGERFDPARPGVMMLSGFSRAAPYRMQGPWHAVGVSLTPVGWAAIAKLSAREARDRYLHGEGAAGPALAAFANELVRRYTSGEIVLGEARTLLCAWIEGNLNPVPKAHEALLGQVANWLGEGLHPPVEALFEATPYSRRQTERLVEQYFCLPPAALARKYRAIRAAALLAQPSLTHQAEADIAEAFYDQPHMVREIRRYCGYTPSRLGGEADPLFHTMLAMRNFDRLVKADRPAR